MPIPNGEWISLIWGENTTRWHLGRKIRTPDTAEDLEFHTFWPNTLILFQITADQSRNLYIGGFDAPYNLLNFFTFRAVQHKFFP